MTKQLIGKQKLFLAGLKILDCFTFLSPNFWKILNPKTSKLSSSTQISTPSRTNISVYSTKTSVSSSQSLLLTLLQLQDIKCLLLNIFTSSPPSLGQAQQ